MKTIKMFLALLAVVIALLISLLAIYGPLTVVPAIAFGFSGVIVAIAAISIS